MNFNFRSLLVHLDGDARCDARTRLAARFVAEHGGHLIGVAPTGPVELGSGWNVASRYADEAAEARADALRRAGRWVDGFCSRCRDEGVAQVEAEVYEGERAAVLLYHAHCADLTVIGQADPASASHRDDERFVEQVLLHSARPTLVVPHAGCFDTIGRQVLIAWDDSHACARAVGDALPLLRHAAQVRLRVWRRAGEAGEAAIGARLAAVQRWLGRQGVAAEVGLETTAAPIGDTLLAAAAEFGADLIVMGSHGHSGWIARLLGSVTRSALTHSPLPLLMSR